MTELSPGQQAGIEKIKNWREADDYGTTRPFYLAGPAGTGKTTMARELPDALGLQRVVYGTYTGKAAHVLRRKGCAPTSTIHSAIYLPTTSQETKERLFAARTELGELQEESYSTPDGPEGDRLDAEIVALESQIAVLEQEARRLHWEWNPDAEWASADLIVLDEVSMVNPKLAADVEAYGVPVLVLGDPAQLPPVEGGGYYTDRTPDHLLTEIHRQALESPVLALATRIRESSRTSLGITPAEMIRPSLRDAMEHDQVLCWSNKRRWTVLNSIRNALGRPPGVPVEGDRIMCLSNNKDLAVFNGQQFTVDTVMTTGALGPTLGLTDDDGHHRTIPVFAAGFQGREEQAAAKASGSGIKGNRMLATFAQAITVHKAQGSEWGSVYVVNETPGIMWAESKRGGQQAGYDMARRWLYTAVSRASERVTVTAAK